MANETEAVVKKGLDKFSFRKGRGFSLKELKEASLTDREAKKLGLKIDPRRDSKHEQNITFLKGLEKPKKEEDKTEKAKAKKSSKKAKKEDTE